MLYCSIDIETTNLDPDTSDLIEFAAVLDDTNSNKPLEQLPVFHRYVLSEDGLYTGDPLVLSWHSDIFKKLSEGQKLFREKGLSLNDDFCLISDLGRQFAYFLEKNGVSGVITPAGKNFSSFDLSFILKTPNFEEHVGLNRTGNKNTKVSLSQRAIDPSIWFYQTDDKGLPNTKQCLERAGIKTASKHTAVEDALILVQLVRAGIKRLNPQLSEVYKEKLAGHGIDLIDLQ